MLSNEEKCLRALNSIYLQVPEAVAKDLNDNVIVYINELKYYNKKIEYHNKQLLNNFKIKKIRYI